MAVEVWRRWSAGTVKRAEVDLLPASELELPQRVPAWAMRRNGRGTRYSLEPHSGAWRSLGEVITSSAPAHTLAVDDVDPARLEQFLRRYGPLYDAEQEIEPFGPSAWALAGDLLALSRAWAPPSGNDDLSRYDPARFDHTAYVATRRLNFLADHPDLREAERLDRQLAQWALTAYADHLPMRRCRACGFWLIATRADRTYCDARCRMQAHEGRGDRGRLRSN
jgi:hypothetical protein